MYKCFKLCCLLKHINTEGPSHIFVSKHVTLICGRKGNNPLTSPPNKKPPNTGVLLTMCKLFQMHFFALNRGIHRW